jgi:L-aminopeptidase/D-esterase-like protein
MISRRFAHLLLLLVLVIALDTLARAPQKSPPPKPVIISKAVRARDLDIPFEGTPGKFNAITDVPGVEVGYTTLISGEGKLEVGKGPVRTGVTAILPRGRASLNDPVYAGFFSLNGNGEMTGTAWVEESGFLEGPIIITNTHSVGVARDAVIAWRIRHGAADKTGYWWSLPVVGETWDGWLNDINGFHVKAEDVWHALDSAHGGALEEGSLGGGTGLICYEFKGGNGTASRKIDIRVSKDAPARSFVVGVFLQANFGRRSQLTITGVPVRVKFTKKRAARASLSSRPMLRSCRISSSDLPAECRSAWPGRERPRETARAICSVPFQPQIQMPRIRIKSHMMCKRFPMISWTRFWRASSKRPKKRP